MDNESYIRLAAFFGVFALMAVCELLIPRRVLRDSKGRRWWVNLAIVVVDTALVRIAFPMTAVQAADLAARNGWGLFNYVEAPMLIAAVLSVIILDAVIYFQHVMFHAIPALWRIHMVHHADLDLDVTSGLRFHPVEILLSMVLKIAVVIALGPPAIAVVIFEVVLNGTAMFNHSNIKLPASLDRLLRLIVVTPDMHRVHHSVHISESNSNFGFNLPWWDRLFRTYTPQPADGHEQMTIGLTTQRDPLGLWRAMIFPIKGTAGNYARGSRLTRRKNKSNE